MLPRTFTITWRRGRSGEDGYCPLVVSKHGKEFDETAQICAALIADGYIVKVFELAESEIPKLKDIR